MDEAIKTEWLTDLRSGQYRQGCHVLRRHYADGDRHCCLGVLCEIAVRHGVIDPPEYDETEDAFLYSDIDTDSHAVLPKIVMEWAGLDERNPAADYDGTTLADMNDQGDSFVVIADVIEKHL